MKASTLRRFVWAISLAILALLLFAIILLLTAPKPAGIFPVWLDRFLGPVSALGAPVLGLVVLLRQPRHRIGWLWLVYGLAEVINGAAYGFYYHNAMRSSGYSPLGYLLLWSSEPASAISLICLLLILLWFPDGRLPGRRWRFLYPWMLAAFPLWMAGLFSIGTKWNGPGEYGSILIENPLGLFPESSRSLVGGATITGWFSFLLMLLIAVWSLAARYRSAGEQVRLQIRWFVLGGISIILLFFTSVYFMSNETYLVWSLIASHAAIFFLYLAIGIAMLRYRLYDIDLVIRRTLQYGALTALLLLLYFGIVTVLQSVFTALGGAQSPVITVISTLAIAALFNPLRRRLQEFIDRRFYRRKYDAEKALAEFADAARSETEIRPLISRLVGVVQESMQPESMGLWLIRK